MILSVAQRSALTEKSSIRAMTLIELIVVMSIIMILAALVGGSLMGAKEQAKRLQCLSNIRSLGQAAILYAQEDPASRFPHSAASNKAGALALLYDPLDFNDLAVFACPLERRMSSLVAPVSDEFTTTSAKIISYWFVPDETGSDPQSDSFPMTNIIMMECSSDNSGNPIDFDDPDFHREGGRSAFLISGKTKMLKKQAGVNIQNQDRANTSYNIDENDLYK